MSIADGAVLAPCAGTNAIGILAFNNSLTLAGSTAMDISKSGTAFTSDLITGSTSLTLGGRLTVTAAGDAISAGDSWDLFNATTIRGAFSSFALPTLGDGLTWNTSRLAVDGTLSVAAVPEPGTISMVALAMFGLIAYAWRKRK